MGLFPPRSQGEGCLSSMQEKDLIDLILGITTQSDRISTLQLALSSAKKHLGDDSVLPSKIAFAYRDHIIERCKAHKSGDIVPQGNPIADLFSGLLLYLIGFEQIGELFCESSKRKTGGIQEAIESYGDDEIKQYSKVIACLRHSLAHSFGLIARDSSKQSHKYKYQFVWSFDDRDDGLAVTPISSDLDEDCIDVKEQEFIIKPFMLIESLKEVYATIIEEHKKGKLTLKRDLKEVKSCFTVKR